MKCLPQLGLRPPRRIRVTSYKFRFTFAEKWKLNMDRRNFFKDLRECSLTLTGLVGLQSPCLVSAASPSSPLAQFQSLGFPFNMSRVTLNDHFSFSPENLAQGRYYTLVTSLFNHQGKLCVFFAWIIDLFTRFPGLCSSMSSTIMCAWYVQIYVHYLIYDNLWLQLLVAISQKISFFIVTVQHIANALINDIN